MGLVSERGVRTQLLQPFLEDSLSVNQDLQTTGDFPENKASFSCASTHKPCTPACWITWGRGKRRTESSLPSHHHFEVNAWWIASGRHAAHTDTVPPNAWKFTSWKRRKGNFESAWRLHGCFLPAWSTVNSSGFWPLSLGVEEPMQSPW